MTEGMEVHQTPRTTQGFQATASFDASQSTETWSRSSSPHSFETGSDQCQKDSDDPEEQDNQEEESSRLSEEVQGHPEEHHSSHLAPDGGWGWVVLAATIMVLALTLAFPSCIGIFYTDLQKEFQASNTETSWLPAIMTAVLHAGGPVCSILVEACGCRATVMVGGILSGLGLVASSFAQTMLDLYFGTGVITGFGFCLCFQPSVTILGHYFVRRRTFASALASTGTALGLSTLPLLANFLLDHFGWRGSLLVLGGVVLNCCVCGAVMRPLRTKQAVKGMPVQPVSPLGKTNGLYVQQQNGLKSRLQSTFATIVPFLYRHLALDLMRTHLHFRAYAIGVSWMMLGFVVPLVYLVPYATENGMQQDRAAMLMAILGLVNITVRPTAALLFGLKCRMNCRFVYVFAGALLVNGLSNCVCCVAADFYALLAYVLIYGASMSIVGSLLFTVLMETVEMSRFHSALGLITIMESATLLLGPPLAGVLVDYFGHYSYVFVFCSASVSTASLYMMASFYCLDRQSYAEKKSNFSPEGNNILKPMISLATNHGHYEVPLQKAKVQDTENVTDV